MVRKKTAMPPSKELSSWAILGRVTALNIEIVTLIWLTHRLWPFMDQLGKVMGGIAKLFWIFGFSWVWFLRIRTLFRALNR